MNHIRNRAKCIQTSKAFWQVKSWGTSSKVDSSDSQGQRSSWL